MTTVPSLTISQRFSILFHNQHDVGFKGTTQAKIADFKRRVKQLEREVRNDYVQFKKLSALITKKAL